MDTNYAKGPWMVCKNSWQHTTIHLEGDHNICHLDLEDWEVDEDNQDALEVEQAKVAALIAAAPELLTALTTIAEGDVMAIMGTEPFTMADVVLRYQRIAAQAIAKAQAL